MKKIVGLFLAWRILLFIPLYIGYLFLTYRANYDYTNIFKFIKPYFPVSNPLLFPWANFDGVHYLSIAANGYSHDQGFFPLYPILIRIATLVFPNAKPFDLTYFTWAFLISNISLFLALFAFYRLIKIDFPQKIAFQSIIFLLVFPTSFFFASLYTESLFFLLALSCLYFARKKKWTLASVLGIFLSATRLVGVVILPALLYEFWISEKKLISNRVLPLLLVPLGFLLYVFYNFWQFKNPLLFIQAHANINPSRSVYSLVLFPQTVYRYLKILATTPTQQYEWWVALLELSSFVFAGFMLYLAWKKKIRPSYIIFSLLTFLVPVSSGIFSGLPRYILVLFPMFMALALVKNRYIKVLYVVVSTVLLFIFLMLFSRGYFIA